MSTRQIVSSTKNAERLKKRHGKGKALSVLAAKLARAVYYMLSRGKIFDADKFLPGLRIGGGGAA